MIEAVEARKASRGTLVQGRARYGKAVKASCGKVWPGQVRLRHGSRGLVCRVWASRGLVSQSCLVTFRRGAAKFGEVRQSRRCKFWHGEVWRVWSGLGSQGFAGHVTVARGEAGQSTVGQGSRGLARQGGAMPVVDWRGSQGKFMQSKAGRVEDG